MKRASLVFFYFGERSYVSRLGQETMPLHLVLKGYDKSVLLHHPTYFGPWRVSDADARHADVVDVPTSQNLIWYLNQLGNQGYEVDLFIFSHGWPSKFLVSKGTYGDNATLDASRLARQVTTRNLRVVWQCQCYGSTMDETWRLLGAKVVAGSRHINFYPTQYARFARAWNSGRTFGESVEASLTWWNKVKSWAYLLGDAVRRLSEWNGKVWQVPLLPFKSGASYRYLYHCWLGQDAREDLSGVGNTTHASDMIIMGDKGICKHH
jgi:hypothetical protein